MRALLILPVAVAVQVLETQQPTHAHVDYDGLRVTLKGIAAQSKEGKIDDSTEESVRAILKTVRSDLMTALDADRGSAQTSYNQAVQSIQECDDDRAAWFNGTGPDTLQAYDDAKVVAQGAHNKCGVQEIALCNTRNTNCDAIDDIVSTIHDTICSIPSFANGDTTAVNAFMNCMTTLVCDNYEKYDAGRTTCRSDCTALSAKTAACHQKQTAVEIKACERETAVQQNCKSYRSCRKHAETGYYATLATTKSQESLFQAQREALECLLCYGNAILNEDKEFSKCDRAPQCSNLTDCPTIIYIDARPPIAFRKCTEPADDKPCDSSWRETAYGEWNRGEISRSKCLRAVDGCQNCTAPKKGDPDDEGKHQDSGCDAIP